MKILGKTLMKVSKIGCGGIPIQRVSQSVVNDIIEEMEKLEMNFIDTARGYTNSEVLFGVALKNRRSRFIIATKSMSRDYEAMKNDINCSLKNLQTDYIDLYQLHNVSVGEDVSGALRALNEAKKEGKIKHVGITTHSLDVLKQVIAEGKYETIQFPYNIVETQAEEIFKEAKRKNIGVIIMKPLAGGAIVNAKLALKYVLNNENVDVVIPGMESITQVKENQSVINEVITEVEKKEIESIKKELSNDFCRRCGYCMPCTIGINIPFTFLCEGYYTRYNLKDWALSRYSSMGVSPSKCIKCGVCEERCPYSLKIIDKLSGVAKIMEAQYE